MSESTPDAPLARTATHVREVLSPEGVPLPFEIASPADRIAALFVDLLIVHGVLLLVWLVAVVLGFGGMGGHALSLFLICSFALRNAYFPWCEIRFGGSTPGKKLFRLRVVSRDGGALDAESVLARNLTREFETFLPLSALMQPQALLPGMPGWAALLGSIWLLAGTLLPLFNRDRLRLGDLLGGTMVVRVPEAQLLADMAAEAPAPAATPGAPIAPAEAYTFSSEQLDVYGIEELQVLEQILRRGPVGEGDVVGRAVAKRIQDKIGWPEGEREDRAWLFLTAYYRQLRARLEHKVLFGVRQEHKKAGKLARISPRGAATAPDAEAPAPGPDPASSGDTASAADAPGAEAVAPESPAAPRADDGVPVEHPEPPQRPPGA